MNGQLLRGWAKHISGEYKKERDRLLAIVNALDIKMESAPSPQQIFTSRKQGFGPGRIGASIPVLLRTGTNVSISPGSRGSDAGRGSAGISPGSSDPFGPGSRHEPGLKGLAPGAAPLVPVGGWNRD